MCGAGLKCVPTWSQLFKNFCTGIMFSCIIRFNLNL
jgi:hypothetical protein